MTQNELLISARSLTQPGPEAAAEYGINREALAADVTRRLRARPDLVALIGADNIGMMEDNHRNHARFMESVFQLYDPEVFVDTVLWVFRAYRSHGFQLAYWPVQFDAWVESLQRNLSEQAVLEIHPFYRWLICNQDSLVRLTEQTPTAV